MLIIAILITLLGASLASFIHAQIYRIEKGWSLSDILTKPSSCDSCGRALNPVDLFPVVGYLIRRGRCPKCGSQVPIIYPVSELLLGLLFLLLFLSSGSLESYLLLFMLYTFAVYDLLYRGFDRTLTNLIFGISALLFLILFLIDPDPSKLYSVGVTILISAVVFLLNRYKRSFGEGDLIVVAILAMWLTPLQLLSVIALSLGAGGFISIFLLLLKKVDRKGYIPFVPFILIGYLLMLFGYKWIERYFDMIMLLW